MTRDWPASNTDQFEGCLIRLADESPEFRVEGGVS
jgi:hypothetical protein